jgi:putative ABC transport system permease protein
MLKNYLTIAIRNLRKNTIFSFINILGLAIGFTSCLLIAVFVYDELNYDKYPKEANKIYRVGLGTGNNSSYPMVDIAVGQGMKDAFPEVKAFTRLLRKGDVFVSYNDKKFKETRFAIADANFFDVFTIPFIKGSAALALTQPNSMVISKAFAIKYFGNEDALGKALTFNGKDVYKVTGMIDKVPDNSHFHFDAFLSMSSMQPRPQTWSNVNYFTYLILDKNADAKKLESKFPELVAKYVVPEVQHDMGVSLAEAQKSTSTFRFFLQPLTDIHLHSNTKYELEANGDINYVYIFGALAIFILLLACVNFMNLSTASSVKRSREVGIRKVMGSLRKQLVLQFLAESTLLTFCAMLLSLLFVFALLPYFNEVSGKNISFEFFLKPFTILFSLGLCLVVGMIAGIYPAFFLSSFKPIKVLKGIKSNGRHKSVLRSGLVIFQFFVSTALIIATIVVYQQLHYMQDKKLGYDKTQVLFLQDTYLLNNNQDAFKLQLLQDSRVVKASIGYNLPGNGNMNGTEITAKEPRADGSHEGGHVNIYNIDEEFIPTLGLQLVSGRNFSKDFLSDSTGVIINEATVQELGWTNSNAIGKTIVRSGQHEYKVVGVVADFHYASVKQIIAPLMMLLGGNYGGIIVKIKTKDIAGFLKKVKQQWDAFKPDGPFSYYFLDEKFASLYAAEKSIEKIFTGFAIIAVLIASLGLFGLAAFITEQRTKEIGIRKVLGASMQQVLMIVCKEFVVLVGFAFLIAVPVTWWGMNKWLQEFAYRINISWWIFLAAGILSIVIALLTISIRSINAAVANPVKSLRTE